MRLKHLYLTQFAAKIIRGNLYSVCAWSCLNRIQTIIVERIIFSRCGFLRILFLMKLKRLKYSTLYNVKLGKRNVRYENKSLLHENKQKEVSASKYNPIQKGHGCLYLFN